MSIFLPHYFEELKSNVLSIAGICNITPCDCKTISAAILNKTKQRISETTLKRVFGFAYSKFKPSFFTIDVMAHYCGYNGWEDFCNNKGKLQPVNNDPENLSWEKLKHNATKITSFTLQALKNRAGIPYNQTIKRKFIDNHFEGFLGGDYAATILSAPAGFGKTIGLCHWIDDRLEQNAKNETNDIILFFSSSALINVFLSGRDISEWFLGLLGYSPNDDIATLLNDNRRGRGKFFLIIDGFDEYMFKAEQYRMLLNQVIDVFAFYRTQNWFKLVLTMRQASWINHKHDFEIVQNNWYTGFAIDNNATLNVPLFNADEIRELCLRINPAVKVGISTELIGRFSHPLYFQFYYKNHKDNFTLNHINNICIYDLISTFILNKVYLGNHSTEKIILLKELVDEMDFKNKVYNVSKLKINHLLKQYSQAYNELLSVGFLRELNVSDDVDFNTYVQFSNNDFLEYTIAKKLLVNNNYSFNQALIDMLNKLFDNDSIKLPVLKWILIYAIKSDQDEGFKALLALHLNNSEKANLIGFLVELFEKECFTDAQNTPIANYAKQNSLKSMFDYFIGIEFLSPEYEKTLRTLLRFELTNVQRITVYSCLALTAISKLDVVKLEEYVNKLKGFTNIDYIKFPLNPLTCIDCVFYYLKYGIIKKEFLADITNFYFNPPQKKFLADTPVNDLIFTMAACACAISTNPHKSLRFIKVLEQHYKKADDIQTGYGFFMRIMCADRYFVKNDVKKALEIYLNTMLAYDKYESTYTPVMKILFMGVKIKASMHIQSKEELARQVSNYIRILEKTDYCLPKSYTLTFLLTQRKHWAEFPEFEKNLQYEFNKTMRECGLQPEIFLSNAKEVLKTVLK
ncbi:MAG: hypothetical protein EOP46_03610 [Sphingobacteriaceae bacterium]|nr:MAG: hypothetical protein EOP46_03610 [Sphingobacteriaceae bacterium]